MERLVHLNAVRRAAGLVLAASLQLSLSEMWDEAAHEIAPAFDALAGAVLGSETLTAASYRRSVETAYEAVANLVNLNEVMPLPQSAYRDLVEAAVVLQDC